MENEITGVIYKATSPSGKAYVGQTVLGLAKRKLKHMADAKTHTYAFANAINKYGIDGFVWEIVESDVLDYKLNDREVFYIKKFNSYKKGYNSTEGGDYNPMIYKENSIKVSEKIKGDKNHRSKLKNSDVSAIRKEYEETNISYKELASKYGVSGSAIGFVIKNITYTDECYIPPESNKHNKLSTNLVNKVREKYKTGEVTCAILEKEFNISHSTIYNIINNIIWTDETYIIPIDRTMQDKANSIRKDYKTEKYTYHSLAKNYGLCYATIGKIIKNKIYVDYNYIAPITRSYISLTLSHVSEIRNKFRSGKFTQTELAHNYNVNPSSISRIINNKSWVIKNE